MKRKISKLFLIVMMIAVLADVAGAAEKIVQLTVPGCFS